ncbi:hypothetical protein HOD75_00980 [archaeon]|jgi:hypothetical protein|nr:hypothetical protein [archaeon]MBT4241451.1 hypothetical protein [archaeon]MBT4417678.1 hypothetical protein [archaeon]
MGFVDFVKGLEKKGIITKNPCPAIVFVLSLIALILGSVFNRVGYELFGKIFYFIFIFAFAFGVLHMIVWLILSKR